MRAVNAEPGKELLTEKLAYVCVCVYQSTTQAKQGRSPGCTYGALRGNEETPSHGLQAKGKHRSWACGAGIMYVYLGACALHCPCLSMNVCVLLS